MQKSYVVLNRVNLTFARFHIEQGDILTYDQSNNNNLSIWRNKKLMKTTTNTPLGMAALVGAKHIALITDPPAAPPVTEETPTPLTTIEKVEQVALTSALVVEAAIDKVESVAEDTATDAKEVASVPDTIETKVTDDVSSVADTTETKTDVKDAAVDAEDEVKDVTADTEGEVTDATTGTDSIVTDIKDRVEEIAEDIATTAINLEAAVTGKKRKNKAS